MEPTKPKLPAEAIQLYNLFIHGEISRRDFFDGVQRFAVGGLAAGAIVEALMPNYAAGQQVPKSDERIKATYETVSSPKGTEASKAISCGLSARTPGPRSPRNCRASSSFMKIAA
jgi:carboxymethylenebutenolidase